LPEALMNYLALLGWAPHGGDRELFTKDELVKEFSLERVTPSPAIFDFEKLYWLNRQYIKRALEDSNAKRALTQTAWAVLSKADYFGDKLAALSDGRLSTWAEKLTELLLPSVDRLEQLPDR